MANSRTTLTPAELDMRETLLELIIPRFEAKIEDAVLRPSPNTWRDLHQFFSLFERMLRGMKSNARMCSRAAIVARLDTELKGDASWTIN